MKILGATYNLIATMILMFMFVAYLNFSSVCEKEFSNARYKFACTQATEAMFRATLEAEDVDIDYQDLTYVKINASDALQVFDRVMCANYNMSYCEDNCNIINQSIVCGAIAGYDGYYVITNALTDSYYGDEVLRDQTEVRFSAKYPYFIKSSDGKILALDTYKKTYSLIENSSYTTASVDVVDTAAKQYPYGVDPDAVDAQINTQIRDRMIAELKLSGNASLYDYTQFRMKFPASRTVTGVNPFVAPGIFIAMQGADYANTDKFVGVTAAGYKVVEKRKVICFKDTTTNRYYYCFQGQFLDEEKAEESGGIQVGGTYGNFEILDYADSTREAAEMVTESGDHYFPHYEMIIRKISPVQTAD